MFRGKECLNRIELSQLVQDLLNFGDLGSHGGGRGVRGIWQCGGTPTHAHIHTGTCTHTYIHVKHDNFNCKWQPPLGESLGNTCDVIASAHAHMCFEPIVFLELLIH